MRIELKDAPRIRLLSALLVIFLVTGGCQSKDVPSEAAIPAIDAYSYNLGVIGGFAEVVGLGIKKLALSAPLPPNEMTDIRPEAERIAEENGVLIWLETDFLVTDLFPEEVTRGKQVLLIYQDPVKDEYLALKREKAELMEQGFYSGEKRRNIARKLGRLLSYPEERIELLLSDTR